MCTWSTWQAFFAKWGDEGVVDLKDELAELIILTASRTLMGKCFLLPTFWTHLHRQL